MHSTPYPLRPLWLNCDSKVEGCAFPSSLLAASETALDTFCGTLQEMGYNSLVFGPRTQAPLQPGNLIQTLQLLKTLKKSGIHIILKPIAPLGKCPLDPAFSGLLAQISKELACFESLYETLFWECGLLHSSYLSHPAARDALLSDLVLKELEAIEKWLHRSYKLVFYVPFAKETVSNKKIAALLEHLCNIAEKDTSVAFSAVAGDPAGDHLPLHPFWERLSDFLDPIYTPLMPVVNLGGVETGAGEWPSIPYDHFNRIYSRMIGHRFAGILALADHLPQKHGLAGCGLWVGAQLQLKYSPADLLVESWLKKHWAGVSYEENRELFHKLRMLVLEIGRLKKMALDPIPSQIAPEEGRLWVESLASQIKLLASKMRNEEQPNSHAILSDYVALFALDAKKIMGQFAQRYNITSAVLLVGEETRQQPATAAAERCRLVRQANRLL